ncbi:hypothetical protein BX070DRAFT_48884 [Coemansia spiralis]|nr:hypothetical protein BX070DRAFT_48884 [Coemansia spiralis]
MPRRKAISSQPAQKSTLNNYFNIKNSSSEKPQMLRQANLDSFFKKELDRNNKPESAVAVTDMEAMELLDSDSDDGLVDPNNILGISVTPSNAQRIKLRPRTTQKNDDKGIISNLNKQSSAIGNTPYRNSLKSLVRAKAQKRYDLSFLDAHMENELAASDSSSGEEEDTKPSSLNDTKASMKNALRDTTKEDIRRIEAQLGAADTDFRKSPVQFSVFTGTKSQSMPYEDGWFDGILFKADDPVDRICEAHRGDLRFFQRLIGSHWLQTQAHQGWKLTQGVGDTLLRVVCFDQDASVAYRGVQALSLFLELQHSSWRLNTEVLQMLLLELQGQRRSKIVEIDSYDADESFSSCSLPDVYVMVERKPPQQRQKLAQDFAKSYASAERVAFLMQVVSQMVDSASVDDICGLFCMFVDCILEHKNRVYISQMQQSLSVLIGKITPASKWTLVWTECVARIGLQLAHFRLPALLRVIECLPIASKRCMQVRHSLAFLFLRLQTSEMAMLEENSLEKLAIAATLPSQIVLRVVGEMMDTSEKLFRIESSTDFVKLEAAIGLLGHVLYSVRALRDVGDEAQEIYRRLCTMNRRINDGMADKIEKTLAKDAIQTLLIRVFMTAISDSQERLDLLYDGSGKPESTDDSTIVKTLDSFWGRPPAPPL